jgi:hypothetical protein
MTTRPEREMSCWRPSVDPDAARFGAGVRNALAISVVLWVAILLWMVS